MIRFFAFYNTKTLLITNFAIDKVKKRYGHKFEIINSIKDRSSLDQVKPRIVRQFTTFQIIEQLGPSVTFTEEIREKLRRKKLGTKRDEDTKAKISATLKGRSSFAGKRHKEKTKFQISVKTRGRKTCQGKIWIYNPRTFIEKKINKGDTLPQGFMYGRDPDSTDPMKY